MRGPSISLEDHNHEGAPSSARTGLSPSRFHDTHGMPEQHVALVVLQGKDRMAGVAVQFLLVANSLVVPSTLWNCAYLPYVK